MHEDVLHGLGVGCLHDAFQQVVAAQGADDHPRHALEKGQQAEAPEEHSPKSQFLSFSEHLLKYIVFFSTLI